VSRTIIAANECMSMFLDDYFVFFGRSFADLLRHLGKTRFEVFNTNKILALPESLVAVDVSFSD